MLDILKNFLNNYAVPFVLRLICAALLLFVGFKLIRTLMRHIQKRAYFTRLDQNVQIFIKNALRILLDTLLIITAVQVLGVPGATVITALGSCGIAIGLALQGGLSNIAGGVIIMLFRPFRVDDYISTPLGDGTVIDIGIFYTTLKTLENTNITIPNSTLSNSTVTNITANPTRRMDIDIGISYDADIDLARRILTAAAESCEGVLPDPSPEVIVTSHGDSSITVTLRIWVARDDYWPVRYRLLEDSKLSLEKFGITIPYPQLDVHVSDCSNNSDAQK